MDTTDTYEIVDVLAEIDNEIATIVFKIQREHESHGPDSIQLLKKLRMVLVRNEGLVAEMIEGYGKQWF